MKGEKAQEWTLRELAAETGVSERTIRFYISRGLVDPPLRGGRGAVYGEKHKARLEAIRALQAKGNTLAAIAHCFALERPEMAGGHRHSKGGSERGMVWFEPDGSLGKDESSLVSHDSEVEPAPTASIPEPETWRSYAVAPDVRVMIKTGASPWRTKALIAALRRFAAEIELKNSFPLS